MRRMGSEKRGTSVKAEEPPKSDPNVPFLWKDITWYCRQCNKAYDPKTCDNGHGITIVSFPSKVRIIRKTLEKEPYNATSESR